MTSRAAAGVQRGDLQNRLFTPLFKTESPMESAIGHMTKLSPLSDAESIGIPVQIAAQHQLGDDQLTGNRPVWILQLFQNLFHGFLRLQPLILEQRPQKGVVFQTSGHRRMDILSHDTHRGDPVFL